jgi:hypothetical protein
VRVADITGRPARLVELSDVPVRWSWIATLIERCSDGVEDQGAAGSVLGAKKERIVSSFRTPFSSANGSLSAQSWNGC